MRKIYRDMASTDHTEQPKTTFQPKTSSKSAFTPIKSRNQPENPSSLASSESTFGSTSKSAFYKRQSSFGTYGSRGGLKKDQLTAQIKDFLGPDDPVVANKSAAMVAETGEGQPKQQQLQGRKLPTSPDDERDRISRTSTPDNAAQFSPKNRCEFHINDIKLQFFFDWAGILYVMQFNSFLTRFKNPCKWKQ